MTLPRPIAQGRNLGQLVGNPGECDKGCDGGELGVARGGALTLPMGGSQEGQPELEGALRACELKKVTKYGNVDLYEHPSSLLRPTVFALLVCSKEHWTFSVGLSVLIVKNKTEKKEREVEREREKGKGELQDLA